MHLLVIERSRTIQIQTLPFLDKLVPIYCSGGRHAARSAEASGPRGFWQLQTLLARQAELD